MNAIADIKSNDTASTAEAIAFHASSMCGGNWARTKKYFRHEGMHSNVSFIWDVLCAAGIDMPVPHISMFGRPWQLEQWLSENGFVNVCKGSRGPKAAHPDSKNIYEIDLMEGDIVVARCGYGFTANIMTMSKSKYEGACLKGVGAYLGDFARTHDHCDSKVFRLPAKFKRAYQGR